MLRYQSAVCSWLSSSSLTLTLGPRRNSGQRKTMLLCLFPCILCSNKHSRFYFITDGFFFIFRIHTEEWCRCIGTIVKHNSEACSWFLNFLAGERGKGHVRYVWSRTTSYWSRNTFHCSLNACQETSKALFVSSF